MNRIVRRLALVATVAAAVSTFASIPTASAIGAPSNQSPIDPPALLTLVGSATQAVSTQAPVGASGVTPTYAPGDRVDFQYAGCRPNQLVTIGLFADPTLNNRLLSYPRTFSDQYGVVRSAILLPINLAPGAYVLGLRCDAAIGQSVSVASYVLVANGRTPSSWSSLVGGWVALSPISQVTQNTNGGGTPSLVIGNGTSSGGTSSLGSGTQWQLVAPNGTKYWVTPVQNSTTGTIHLAHTGLTVPLYLGVTLGAVLLGASLLVWTSRRRARYRA